MRVSRPAVIAGVSSAVALILLAAGIFVLIRHHQVALKRPAPKLTRAAAAPVLRSPFTGEPVRKLGPELIYKIDNVQQARPPTGLKRADIVYILPVEGGLSRIFAVFSSHFPPVIGPVRSARAEDLELLRQFGHPAFVYSGAQPELLPVVEHDPHIVDLYAGIVGGFWRDENRIAPYNLYSTTKVLLAEAKGASKARGIGFTFGPAPVGGRPAASYSVSYPAAAFTFRWSASQRRWLSWMDGRPAYDADGGQLGGPTVVIQSVVVGASHFRELGIKPPYANTVGGGTAIVLRNGRAYPARWSRPNASAGTTFTQPDGRPMPFARGQVWIVYAYRPGSTGQQG